MSEQETNNPLDENEELAAAELNEEEAADEAEILNAFDDDDDSDEITISKRTLFTTIIAFIMIAAVVVVVLVSGLSFANVANLFRGNPAVVTVNGEKIKGNEFADRLWFEYFYQTGGQPLSTFGIDSRTFAEFARDSLVSEILIVQKAAEIGVEISDEEVTAEVEAAFGLVEDGSNREEYEDAKSEYLTGFTEATGIAGDDIEAMFNDRVRIGLLARAMMEEMEFDLEETQEAVNAAHILVATEEEALAVLERLDGGETFEDLATELSLDPGSGAQGGALGWIYLGQTVPEFEEAAFALEVGTISPPVQSQFGWHIIKAIEHDMVPTPEAQLAQMRQQAFIDQLDTWREEADIEIAENWAEFIPELPE